jgi:hypothetical protein
MTMPLLHCNSQATPRNQASKKQVREPEWSKSGSATGMKLCPEMVEWRKDRAIDRFPRRGEQRMA